MPAESDPSAQGPLCVCGHESHRSGPDGQACDKVECPCMGFRPALTAQTGEGMCKCGHMRKGRCVFCEDAPAPAQTMSAEERAKILAADLFPSCPESTRKAAERDITAALTAHAQQETARLEGDHKAELTSMQERLREEEEESGTYCARHRIASKERDEIRAERDALRETRAQTRKHLADANRGAETNARLNRRLAEKVNELRQSLARVEREREELMDTTRRLGNELGKSSRERDEANRLITSIQNGVREIVRERDALKAQVEECVKLCRDILASGQFRPASYERFNAALSTLQPKGAA